MIPHMVSYFSRLGKNEKKIGRMSIYSNSAKSFYAGYSSEIEVVTSESVILGVSRNPVSSA